MSAKRFSCWKCGAQKKRGRMAAGRTFCNKCRKKAPAAVKAQKASLGKGLKPVTVINKVAKANMVTKSARPYAPQPPRFTAGPVPWIPEQREAARPQSGGPEQAEMLAAHNIARAQGYRSVREMYQMTAQSDTKELARRVMLLTGERF